MSKNETQLQDDYETIFVSYITVKGKRLYARAFGKRAWPIKVKRR